jgi:hypothetical protein
MSIFAFFSSPPAAAITKCPLLVTMTSLCLFFIVLEPKNRCNLLGVSLLRGSPCLEVGECGGGDDVTTRLPSLRMRSLLRVRTGDHSMSSWEGGGSSVMSRGEGRRMEVLLLLAAIAMAFEGPE